ncbi:uncharacterized protein N7483_008443 [Penicillium malachiteum]|uniref:uncharacterized protein n=1 Tax=Penicillium malachiteum TaxID=1324776 RepID=UPI00254795BD|nr:uncharacterized protein N7483_008443 [Penicillium malachiteum]KAJ5720509.1 hypothetical protein N7483_008443 [Penicillium malachiteum]
MATYDYKDHVIYPAFCFKASPTHFTWVKMSVADVHRLQKPRSFEGQRIYFYKNHPIRFVTIAGLIVSKAEVYRRTILTIDDSSGALAEVVIPHSSDPKQQPGSSIKQTESSQSNPNTSGQVEPESQEDFTLDAKDTNPKSGVSLVQHVHVSTTDQSIIDISGLVPGTMVKVKGTLTSWRGVIQLNMERFHILRDTNAEMVFLNERLQFLVEVLSSPWVLSDEEIEMLRREGEDGDLRAAEERSKAQIRVKRRAEREEKDAKHILRRYKHEEREREKEAVVCREEGERIMREILERKRAKLARGENSESP